MENKGAPYGNFKIPAILWVLIVYHTFPLCIDGYLIVIVDLKGKIAKFCGLAGFVLKKILRNFKCLCHHMGDLWVGRFWLKKI